MQIFLMQHGQAVSADVDPQRPLSDLGRSEVVAVGRYAAQVGVRIPVIWHSDKLRAVQTAEVLGREIASTQVEQRPGLTPSADPEKAAAQLRRQPADASVCIVSHLPFLDHLAGLLVCGDPTDSVIAFRNAGLVALTSHDDGWRVGWILTPELVHMQ